MLDRAPGFWWLPPSLAAWALSPLAALYGAVAERRMRDAPQVRIAAPVLCIGNPTVGGSGKTPVAIALGKAAKTAGRRPGFLSRGHGGTVGAARLVDPARDTAADVGDEPLLLALHAPVAAGADRAAGGRLLLAEGCDFLIMDDGFQSGRIAIDFALLVIDRRRGIGNGFCLPAGPLRAPLGAQLARAQALLAVGEGDAADFLLNQAAGHGLPLFGARLAPVEPHGFAGRRVLAFAGIGFPDKFFRSLEAAGAAVARRRSFPDHHAFRPGEIAALERAAARENLDLATTAKDAARLRGTAPPAFAAKLHVLEIEARFTQPGTPAWLVEETLRNWPGLARL